MILGKRYLKGIVVSLMIGLLSFCMNPASLSAAENSMTKTTLYDYGIELIEVISEMASSDAFALLYFPQGEIADLIASIGRQDHSSPVAVYQLQIDTESLLQEQAGNVLDQLSESLINQLRKVAASAISAMINAKQNNSAGIAASSICSTEMTFVTEELTEDTWYLYVFESAVPVLVTFVPGDDHSVSANAQFIISDDNAVPVNAETVKDMIHSAGIPAELSEISLPAGEG